MITTATAERLVTAAITTATTWQAWRRIPRAAAVVAEALPVVLDVAAAVMPMPPGPDYTVPIPAHWRRPPSR
jgi:hypothetical protein